MTSNSTNGLMKASPKVVMKAKNANILTLLLFSVVLQMTVLNTAQANDDEIEADFLEFLATESTELQK